MYFYSPNPSRFATEETHGARRIRVVDPAWDRPRKTVILQPGQSVEVGGKVITNTGADPMPVDDVPDMDAVPSMVEVDNPDCKIPADAVGPISAERHAELKAEQTAGRIIVPGPDGWPVAVERPGPTEEMLLATAKAARASAFAVEADPLYFQWKRGEATEEEWLAKVAEIRARYPYPDVAG